MTKRTVLVPTLIAAAMLVACLVALLAMSREAEAAFPGQNGRVAFVGAAEDGTRGGEIFTMLPDGSRRLQLTNASGSRAPDFSADGAKITYAGSRDPAESDQDVYVMDRFGNGKRALTDNDLPEYSPAWSPDGTEIAFTRQSPAGGAYQVDVWVMDADGSGKRNLTPDAAMDAFPDWSPDGKKLAFASYRQYKPYEIYTMNLDGTGVINVTKTRYVNEAEPAWSPSGTRIVYRKDSASASGISTEIRTKNADGSGNPKAVSNGLGFDGWPDWGPRPTTAP